jgi:hypothetical protein
MTGTGTVAVAFTPAPSTQSPNIRAVSDLDTVASYHRAIVVTFASVRRWNPHLSLALVTDCEPPGSVADTLSALDVQVLETKFEHRPPDGFWPRFNASLYTIDVMAMLAHTAAPADRILLLDPDVLCVGELTPVLDAIKDTRILVYPTGFPDDEKSQGLSALDAVPLHRELDPDLQAPPTHYGGELYGFTPAGALPLLQRADDAWQLALANWARGQRYFVTEEHLLNYALRRVPLADATIFIRRIWTAPVYRTVKGDEGALLLWHLPSEKDRGFVDIAAAVTDPLSWFWTDDHGEYVRRAGSFVGIPRRVFSRFTYDVAAGAVRAAQGVLLRR